MKILSKNRIKNLIYTVRADNYRLLRCFLEPVGIDYFSKPYGMGNIEYHNKLINQFNYKNGFFLEIGGMDGYFHSPTYYLEKFKKWKGILIEPNPFYVENCKINRRASTVYNFACVSFSYNKDSVVINNCGHSTHIDGTVENKDNWVGEILSKKPPDKQKIEVPAKTVTEILDYHFKNIDRRQIDLFVLDVEEYETEVLKGLEFSKYSPKYILVECHNEKHRVNVEQFLNVKGYDFEKLLSTQDYLFSLKSKAIIHDKSIS